MCHCCKLHCYVGIHGFADLFVVRNKSVNAVGGWGWGWIMKQRLAVLELKVPGRRHECILDTKNNERTFPSV
jgi:hypothetical protein